MRMEKVAVNTLFAFTPLEGEEKLPYLPSDSGKKSKANSSKYKSSMYINHAYKRGLDCKKGDLVGFYFMATNLHSHFLTANPYLCLNENAKSSSTLVQLFAHYSSATIGSSRSNVKDDMRRYLRGS